jgi:peptidoglycan hydrolase-like protein with peptidoglycan-binding domain
VSSFASTVLNMTPGLSRAFFAVFTAFMIAATINVLRQPPRTAVVIATARPAHAPVVTPASVAVPAVPVAIAPGAPAVAAQTTPDSDVARVAKKPVPSVEPQKAIVIAKMSEPVRVEGRLPSAAVVGQLPLPAVEDADADVVTAIQKALVDNGFGPLVVNGAAGPLTRAAVMGYEYEHGLALTGEASERLLKRLRGEADLKPKREPDSRRIVTREAEQVVLIVQKSLQMLGHGSGKIDGRLTADTDVAIRSFEAELKLTPSGRITADLFSRLARAVGARTAAQAGRAGE